jgi:hypothetical protein
MRSVALALIVLAGSAPAHALPNMIRLGYANCVSCHVAPQGGGLLNAYGRGIDEAQSRRGGEYAAGSNALLNDLTLGGRIDQDFRAVASLQLSHAAGGPYKGVDRVRFFYRNVTNIGAGFRVSAVVNGEHEPSLRKSLAYDPVARPGSVIVTSALVQYRPKEGIELAAGQDALPTGLNIPDQTTFIKSRNRLGYYDAPVQAKAFLWGKRWSAVSFVFAPGTEEFQAVREKGGGVLAEYDLLGKGTTVVGVTTLHGSDRLGRRAVGGAYTRLGFGSFGILAEHDFTRRRMHDGTQPDQSASYLQVFYYPREWAAVSGIAEQVGVQAPYSENLRAYKGELSLRFTSNLTIGFRAGVQHDVRTGNKTPIASAQLTLKSVN